MDVADRPPGQGAVVSFLDRYRAGEHREVCRELTGRMSRLPRDHALAEEADGVAIEAMTRVARNVDRLLGRLSERGYIFEVLAGHHAISLPLASRALIDARTRTWHGRELPISAFRACEAVEMILGGPLPITLRKQFELVGAVDFCGTAPDWPRSGHLGLGPHARGVMSTNPLVLRGVHDLLLECIELQFDENLSLPLDWTVWPDAAAKAGYSGAGHALRLPDHGFDALVDSAPMLDHLRNSLLRWGGFPGAANIDDFPKSWIADLTADLEHF